MSLSYRPGVYSRYDVIRRRKNVSKNLAFFCGGAKLKAGKNIPAGTMVQLHSSQQLTEFFEPTGQGKMFYQICRILLEAGLESVYAVPLTTDGSIPDTSLYEPAFRKLCGVKRSGVILCDSMEISVLTALSREISAASQNEKERIAVCAVLKAAAVEAANQLNTERMVLCVQEGTIPFEEPSVFYTAAAMGAMIAEAEPDRNFHGEICEGLSDVSALSEEEVEELLKNGITVFEQFQEKVQCIRCVTTRTHTAGEADRTFSSINTILMIDDIIRSVRERLAQLIQGKTAAFSEDSIASQAAVILDEKLQQGYVTSFEPPVVYRQESDPSVCIIELEFDLAAVVSRIYLTAHIIV